MAPTSSASPYALASGQAAVHVRGLEKSFSSESGPRLVLRDIRIDVAPGEIVAMIGASGSGKSTLLRLIAGLDEPSAGDVLIGEDTVAEFDERCAVAFQSPRLLPWRTVFENVHLGLPKGIEDAKGRDRVARLLDLVQLTEFADHKPREISGGMAQRTSLARALARSPQVLLLDEPFGALDALTRLKMHDLLLDIHKAEPTTIVFVTHDVDEALTLADSVLVLGSERDALGDKTPGATIVRQLRPAEPRPRSHNSPEFVEMRSTMLAELGVSSQSER